MQYAFPCHPAPSVAIQGSAARFPVRRIFCAGNNYHGHLRQMGAAGPAGPEPPFFFCKPADAVVGHGEAVPYPPRTRDLHHEIELVIALGRGGRDLAASDALGCVFGYAVGNDLTRRDLQLAALAKGRPWDMGKGFDRSACISNLREVSGGHPKRGRIWLAVNGETRQDADLAEMIFSPAELIAELSTLVELCAGDLIYTGTPAGVGAVRPGDRIEAGIDDVGVLENRIV